MPTYTKELKGRTLFITIRDAVVLCPCQIFTYTTGQLHSNVQTTPRFRIMDVSRH
jgi:hypothetical protein